MTPAAIWSAVTPAWASVPCVGFGRTPDSQVVGQSSGLAGDCLGQQGFPRSRRAKAASRQLATASTAQADLRKSLGGAGKGGNTAAASQVGKLIAEKAKAAGVEKVAFDRAGFAYHRRVKALADAAREAGLQF